MFEGVSFAKEILTVCWDGILDVLSSVLSERSSGDLSSSLSLMLNAREETEKARQAICLSLEGLQRAARLTSILGMIPYVVNILNSYQPINQGFLDWGMWNRCLIHIQIEGLILTYLSHTATISGRLPCLSQCDSWKQLFLCVYVSDKIDDLTSITVFIKK